MSFLGGVKPEDRGQRTEIDSRRLIKFFCHLSSGSAPRIGRIVLLFLLAFGFRREFVFGSLK